MQLPILRTLALVAVGNAALRGRDVKGFWPDDPMFAYTASLVFMAPRENAPLGRVAETPESWFKKLAHRGCSGLRLHNSPMRPNQKLGHIDPHILVGLVGGGPRWFIEPVYGEHSELWEGFDRIGDKNAADKKIWLSAYILIGEAESAARVDADIGAASRDLKEALAKIEPVAREIAVPQFAEAFAAARVALEGKGGEQPPSFVRFTDLKPDATRLLNAAGRAWVFGAMGSWNDLAPADAMKQRYEATSKALFTALQRAVIVVANSTYRR